MVCAMPAGLMQFLLQGFPTAQLKGVSKVKVKDKELDGTWE